MWFQDTEKKSVDGSNPIDSAVFIVVTLLVIYVFYRIWKVVIGILYEIAMLVTGSFRSAWKGIWALLYDMVVLGLGTVLFLAFFNVVFSYMWTEIASFCDMSSLEPFIENSSVVSFMRKSTIFSWVFQLDYLGMLSYVLARLVKYLPWEYDIPSLVPPSLNESYYNWAGTIKI